jgi:hypothetical protein
MNTVWSKVDTIWVARDKEVPGVDAPGSLNLFLRKPKKSGDYFIGPCWNLPCYILTNITFENSPKEIKITVID